MTDGSWGRVGEGQREKPGVEKYQLELERGKASQVPPNQAFYAGEQCLRLAGDSPT